MERVIQQNKILRQFYKELWEWVTQGCPPHNKFHRTSAICTNLRNNLGWQPTIYVEEIHNELLMRFFGSNLPFNTDIGDFQDERYSNELGYYNNPLRLAWIWRQTR